MDEPGPSHAGYSNGLAGLLQMRYGDKYFLHSTTEGFHHMLDTLKNQGKRRDHIPEFSSKQLLEISKRALKNGEINIAEQYAGRAIRKEKYEDASKERNPEPYYHLAEVLREKASDETVELLQRQKFLLQAASLYNFVRNCFNKSTVESEFATTHESVLPGKISNIQERLITATEGNNQRCRFNNETKKAALKQLREESRRELGVINVKYDAETGNEEEHRKIFIKQAAEVRDLYKKIASKMKQFFAEIIQECLEVLGEPPCEYEVILLGSLARDEMTPYSDLEWAILTSSDDKQAKPFFRHLTNLVHLQIINLGETILPCMDIKVLKGEFEWFYDDVTPKGISFDGLLDQASKTPLGNTKDFELIHSPTEMANFQSNVWYNKDPRLGEILLNVAPLEENRHALLDEYNMGLEKILREPCDLNGCAHDSLNTKPTRGTCRGLRTLREDITRYEPRLLGLTLEYEGYVSSEPEALVMLSVYDGKLFDVKKEIYRLTDRVVVALLNVFGIEGKGSFEALDKLCERNVISASARDNVASAVAIALKMRLSTYLSAGKQEEAIKGKAENATSAYHIPGEKELFHFFYVSTPLFESLHGLCNDAKNSPDDLAQIMFFSFSDAMKGHIYCRLLNYNAASKCYKRALQDDPGNISIQMRLQEIETMLSPTKEDYNEWDDFTKYIIHGTGRSFKYKDYNNLVKEGTEMKEIFISAIKHMGISVQTIIILNCLSDLLILLMKKGEAYKCLQRAFTMGQTIFGNNPNLHYAITSMLLGNLCIDLGKLEESIFYLERSIKLLPFSEANENFTLGRSGIYRRLAMSYAARGDYEKAISYAMEDFFLDKGSGVRSEPRENCASLCQIALIWSWAGENEMAMECLRNANEILKNAEGVEPSKLAMTSYVAYTYSRSGKIHEAKLLLYRGLEETQNEFKIYYLELLGKLCWDHDFTIEAEQHFKEIIKIQRESHPEFAIVSTLLILSKIVIKNNKSSEAVSYLEEAAKYLSDQNDNDGKFDFLNEIAERWESLEDYNRAEMYLTKALELCEKSALNSEMELRREIDLHVKLGDLLEKVNSLKGAEESSITKEKVKNDQRKHYDQAYDLLQQYLVTARFSRSVGDLVIHLVKKFMPFDVLKSGELLALLMNMTELNEETLQVLENLNEQLSDLLFTEGVIKLEEDHYDEALEFFRRSLKIELKIHVSDPFHSHIGRIFRTRDLLLATIDDACRGELETIKQDVLEIWEQHEQKREEPTTSVDKANCFVRMAYLCVYLHDYEKAEELNHIAFDIFANAKESKDRQIGDSGVKWCNLTNLTLEFVKQRKIQNKAVTTEKLIYFGKKMLPFIRDGAKISVKEIVFNCCNAFDDSEFENKNCRFLSEETKKQISQCSRLLRDEQGGNQDTEYCTNAQNKRIKYPLKAEYHKACLLARSILRNSNQSYSGTKENTFISLIESLSGTRSCVNFFIKEAENARNKKDIHKMIVFLELASSQALVPECEAKISKLVGDCLLHLQSYRMAAINFKKAADFYRSVHSSKLNHKVVYMESLIGLAKSRVLCNDLENALRACEEGLGIEPEQTTSALSEENLELLYLTMKCAFLLITRSSLPDERVHLKHCYERFYTILGEVDYFRPKADTGMEDDEFFAILKQCKFCFVISVIRECISFHLAKSEEERMNARQRAKSLENSFNVNIFNTNTRECRKSDVEEIQRVRRHCRSWIGQLLVIIGETENAVIHLKKSLAGFFVPDFTGSIIPLDEIIPLLDAITATNAASSSAQESQSLFQQTLELCRDEYLKVNDNPFPLLNFFRNLGNHFVDGGRTWEATHAYNAGLEVVQNLISDATDQVNARNEMMLHLANVHRLQALENTGKGEVEESRLAEKYYKFENGNGTEKSSIHKNIMYANFLCDKGRFEEAIVVVNKAIEADDKLWSTTVICSFSERVLYGSDVKNYIESDGELLTKMGNLAYTTLVCAYVQLGNGREACKALDTLLKNGEDLPPSAIYTTSCLSHLIGFCQKYLLSLVKDRMKLSFPDSEFTLSPENLAKLYYELDPTRKLSSLRFIADALVMMGRGDESISYYREFLLLMDRCEGVLDKSFDEQHAIISHLSFPESRYVYLALGSVMLEHQDKIDDAIACYQHCLVLAMGLSDDTYQDSVAILTALYQTKALTNGKEDQTIYQKWMDKAQECFQNLVSKNVKMTSFVQTTFASFLLRTEQFAEAISHFEQLLDIETNSSIAYCQVGIPLFGVHMAREIKARGKVCVQLKVHIYYLIALAYFQCGKIEKAQESALQMEEYVENISSTPYYLISRSLLAYAYKETGNERKAMEILKTVLESEPDNVAVKLALEECAAIEEATSSCNQI